MFPWNPYNPYFPCLWKQSSDFRVFFFTHAKKGNMETNWELRLYDTPLEF